MRLVAVLAFTLFLSAPMLADETLAPEEVGRFIAAAEQIAAAVPVGSDGTHQHPIAQLLTDTAVIQPVIARHGFSERRWRSVGNRVLAAHRAELILRPMAVAAAAPVRKRPDARTDGTFMQASVTAEDQVALRNVAREMRNDLAAFARDTEEDRKAIAPFRDRLDALIPR